MTRRDLQRTFGTNATDDIDVERVAGGAVLLQIAIATRQFQATRGGGDASFDEVEALLDMTSPAHVDLTRDQLAADMAADVEDYAAVVQTTLGHATAIGASGADALFARAQADQTEHVLDERAMGRFYSRPPRTDPGYAAALDDVAHDPLTDAMPPFVQRYGHAYAEATKAQVVVTAAPVESHRGRSR